MTEEELKKFDGSDGPAYVAYGGKEKELDISPLAFLFEHSLKF